MGVHVSVGPVPSSSVLAFVGYARDVLAGGQAATVSPDVNAAFWAYLDEWERRADAGPDFVWETTLPVEVGEYLAHAFYRLAHRVDEAAGESGPAAPPEGEAFYRLLVKGLLDAMAGEGPAPAEFAEHLRSFWPGGADL